MVLVRPSVARCGTWWAALVVPWLLLFGCGKKQEAAVDAGAPEPDASVARPAPDAEQELTAEGVDPVVPPRRRTFRVTLRSTPPGAEVAIDGNYVGSTPVLAEVVDDGKLREFTFSLPDHKMARYRLAIVKDGVVHGILTPLPYRDAGP